MEDQFTSVQWDRDESKIITKSDTAERNGEENINWKSSLPENSVKEDYGSTAVPEHGPEHDHLTTPTEQEIIQEDTFLKYNITTIVSDPIRDIDQASKPYTSYLITTTTDNPLIIKLTTKSEESQGKQRITCRRRYGDFRNLYHCLQNDYPMALIPSLPSKYNLKYLTGDTFSQEFIKKRLNSLNRFIKYLNSHKVLSQLPIYHLFLSDSNDWISFSKNLKININEIESESQGGLSNVMNRVVNEELTETVMNFLTPSKHKKETNKDILEISDKLKKLYENLLKLDKIFNKLNRKNHDLSQDYNLFLVQLEKLSVINEEYEFIQKHFGILSNNFKGYLESWLNLFKFIDESFLVVLKDCSKCIVNLTNLIELQHNKKIDLQVLQEYLDKAKAEYNALPTSSTRNLPPSPIKNHSNGVTQLIKDTLTTSGSTSIGASTTELKKVKLENKIHKLEEEIEMQTKLVNDLIYKIVNEEYPNWDQFNREEIKLGMIGLCDNQIEFYQNLVDTWNETETQLTKRIRELS